MKTRLEKQLVRYLPASAATALGVLYGYLVPSTKSFSQHGEDLIVRKFFQKIGVKTGFYIDIGAYHPRFVSNTYRFHRLGWHGVCVDLDQEKLRWFKSFRGAAVDTICAGVAGNDASSNNEAVTFYKHKRLLSEIDTLDEDTAMANKQKLGWDYTTTQVPLIGINEILRKYAHKAVDFLNIDVEGIDEDLLLSLDFSICKPTVILFEDNRIFGGSDRVRTRLEENGYAKLFISGGSVAYYLTSATAGPAAALKAA